MDESRATGPDGALWTHEVVVIIPRFLKYRNISTVYLTGDCNDKPGENRITKTDMDVIVVDTIAKDSQSITIAVK
jgi:PhoPQ-activated pathogenicity-related protein